MNTPVLRVRAARIHSTHTSLRAPVGMSVCPPGRPGPEGTHDWAGLYCRFQAFLDARRAAAAPRSTPRAKSEPMSSVDPHVCNARRCVVFSAGDFHVCAHTGSVHHCADVYTCEYRQRDDGYVVCPVSGFTKRDDELTPFGSVIGYAGKSHDAAPPSITSNARKRRGDDDMGARALTARYTRARFCDSLAGVTQLIPSRVRDAILTGETLDADAGGAIAPSRVDRQAREFQVAAENESDLTWFCTTFVRKDADQVMARQKSSTEIRWRKAVNEYISDCVSVSEPVCLMPLLSFVTKLILDSDRWAAEYRRVPAACIDVIRDWVAARVRMLWQWFRSVVKRRNHSPLKYHFGYHALAVMYCSQTGIEWHEGSGGRGGWILSPIPYLSVLLPSQKELSNHKLGRHGSCASVKKNVFTHTQKMTRNWLCTLTKPGECATEAVDAPFAALVRKHEAENEARKLKRKRA